MIRDFIYVCSDCKFVECQEGGESEIDKCPYCKGDDWITYERMDDAEDECEGEDDEC